MLFQKAEHDIEEEHAYVAQRMQELDDMVRDIFDFLKPQDGAKAQAEFFAGSCTTTFKEAAR